MCMQAATDGKRALDPLQLELQVGYKLQSGHRKPKPTPCKSSKSS